MKVKNGPKNSEFKQRCREVFQVAKQTITIAQKYFSAEEEGYLDRLIVINNQNNFKESQEEINYLLGELCFKATIEEKKSEAMIAELKREKDKVALPELHVAIIRGLCFKAIIHATEYMLSKGSKTNEEFNQLSLTHAYLLLKEVEEIL